MTARVALVAAAVLGATARWGLATAIDTDPHGIGWATLAANVLGSLVLGAVAHDLVGPHRGARPAALAGWRVAVAVGFCGGLTTFSTLAVHVAEGLRDDRIAVAVADLGLSVVVGIVAVLAGVALGRRRGERVVTTAIGFALAAALGALVRAEASRANRRLPYGTFAVNVGGALALGLLVGLEAPAATIAGVGGIGTLTTFSTFCLEVVRLWSGGDRTLAVGYVAVTCVAGVAAASLGIAIAP